MNCTNPLCTGHPYASFEKAQNIYHASLGSWRFALLLAQHLCSACVGEAEKPFPALPCISFVCAQTTSRSSPEVDVSIWECGDGIFCDFYQVSPTYAPKDHTALFCNATAVRASVEAIVFSNSKSFSKPPWSQAEPVLRSPTHYLHYTAFSCLKRHVAGL